MFISCSKLKRGGLHYVYVLVKAVEGGLHYDNIMVKAVEG